MLFQQNKEVLNMYVEFNRIPVSWTWKRITKDLINTSPDPIVSITTVNASEFKDNDEFVINE